MKQAVSGSDDHLKTLHRPFGAPGTGESQIAASRKPSYSPMCGHLCWPLRVRGSCAPRSSLPVVARAVRGPRQPPSRRRGLLRRRRLAMTAPVRSRAPADALAGAQILQDRLVGPKWIRTCMRSYHVILNLIQDPPAPAGWMPGQARHDVYDRRRVALVDETKGGKFNLPGLAGAQVQLVPQRSDSAAERPPGQGFTRKA